MEVEDRLTRFASLVHDDPVTARGSLAAQLRGEPEQFADLVRSRIRDELAEIAGVSRRDYEQVRRRLRVQVAYREHRIIAKYLVGFYFATNDFAKDAAFVHGFIRSNSRIESGLGTIPCIELFAANETTE